MPGLSIPGSRYERIVCQNWASWSALVIEGLGRTPAPSASGRILGILNIDELLYRIDCKCEAQLAGQKQVPIVGKCSNENDWPLVQI